jgi:methanethiol S-methyltransferase
MKKEIRERLVSPILMWIIVIAGILFILKFIPSKGLFSLGVFGIFILIIIVIYWLYFFINSIIVHRKAALSVKEIDKIVDTGMYRIVRHPIYSADITLAWGIFLFVPNLNVLLAVIWMNLVLFIWMRLEEKALIDKFGKKYLDYKKQVPMFIPFLK